MATLREASNLHSYHSMAGRSVDKGRLYLPCQEEGFPYGQQAWDIHVGGFDEQSNSASA